MVEISRKLLERESIRLEDDDDEIAVDWWSLHSIPRCQIFFWKKRTVLKQFGYYVERENFLAHLVRLSGLENIFEASSS